MALLFSTETKLGQMVWINDMHVKTDHMGFNGSTGFQAAFVLILEEL